MLQLRGGILFAQFIYRGDCQYIASFILAMASMTLQPFPLNLMCGSQGIELSPEILVLDRFLVGRAPTAPFPSRYPGGDAILEIFRIGEQLDLARFLHGGQRRDGRLQLHPIVGSGRVASTDLFPVSAVLEHSRPTARTGIALACSVSMDCDFFHKNQSNSLK